MDVISNKAENRNKCDDDKSNSDLVDISQTLNGSNLNVEPTTSFVDEKKTTNRPVQVGNTNNLDVITTTQDTKLDNVDKINQFCKYTENKFILHPKNKSVEVDNNKIKTTLGNCNIYNSDNIYINRNIKSDTSYNNGTSYTTNHNQPTVEEATIPDIDKISSNNTSDSLKNVLLHSSLNENLKLSAQYSPYLSNRFCEKVCTEVEENMSRIITSKNNDTEVFCNNDNQILQPESCLFITGKCSAVAPEDSFVVVDNKINTGCAYRSMKSYESNDNMRDENTLNIDNNCKIVDIKDKNSLKNQKVNNSNFLQPIKNYSETQKLNFENDAEIRYWDSHDIKPSTNKQKVKNNVNENSMIPVIISNTRFYENKLNEEVSSSKINKKKLVNSSDHFLKIESENLRNFNIASLCEEKNFFAPSCSSNTLPKDFKAKRDLKDFITETKKNNVNQFPNNNYTADHFQFSQPCLEYEKNKSYPQARFQNSGQEKHLSFTTFPHKEMYNKNYSKTIIYTDNKFIDESKTDNSIISWYKDDSQNKNISDNNKIMQPKSLVSSLVNDTNAYNSNISMMEDRCPKFTIKVDGNAELTKHYKYSANSLTFEPLLCANKPLSYVNSHMDTKPFNKKYISAVPTKHKTLSQLQMNPPDFSKISLIEPIQNENETSKNTREFSAPQKKKCSRVVTSLSFEEISKKYNYIKDLQLKNPISNDNLGYKETLKQNFDTHSHNSYSNLYVKTPDFSAENLSKSEENEKINSNKLTSCCNTNHISSLKNDLPTTEPNILYDRSYSEVTNKSPILPNMHITSDLNKTNPSNKLGKHSTNNFHSIETKMLTDNKYYEKCRVSDTCNQYYLSYPLNRAANPTATYQVYTQDLNSQTNARNDNLPNTHLIDEQFSQNYFQDINNYRNCNENMDYNVKRTTSVIQSGKHVNLEQTNCNTNILNCNSVPQSVSNNFNNKQPSLKSPEQEIPNYVGGISSSLNSKKPFLNNPQKITVATSSPNLQSCGWQTNNEDLVQQNLKHQNILRNSIASSLLQNTKNSNNTKKFAIDKPYNKQLKKPSHLPFEVPQNCKVNSYCANSQSYYVGTANIQEKLPSNIEKNISESSKYKYSTNKLIEYNNPTNLYTEENKYVKANELNAITHSVLKNSIPSPIKCSPETSRSLQKPNYREMINHVYAMRNSITEDDLNLQIIKRTLNCDLSLRRSENDLSQNIFDFPISKKSSSTYLTGNNFYYPRGDEKTIISRKQYNIENIQNGYTEKEHDMPISNKDICVTLSKVPKLLEMKPCTVEMKNNIILNSDYPKAIITKVVNKKTDKTLIVGVDCNSSKSLETSTGSTTKNFMAPLDLSVKTVKTIADSTGSDDINIESRIRTVEGARSAPKFVFQPDFSNTGDNNNEKNTILQSVTSSIKLNNNQELLSYSKHIQSKNDIQNLNAVVRKCCSNKIDSFTSTESKFQPVSENIELNIAHYRKDHQNNKLESKLLVPSSDIDLCIEGNPSYEFQNKDANCQHPGNAQNVNTIHPKNIILPTPDKFENKLLKMCNTTNDLYVASILPVSNLDIHAYSHAKIKKYESTVLQKTKNIKEHQIGHTIRNQNKSVKNNMKRIDITVSKNKQALSHSVKFNNQINTEYVIKKRPSDITKQTPAKKIRVDDMYRAHLEETTKRQTNNFMVDHVCKFSDIPNHPEQNNETNDQIFFDGESNPNLGYSDLRSQTRQKKIWYPPMECKYNPEKLMLSQNLKPENYIFPGDTEDSLGAPLLNNFPISRGVNRNVLSKLKNSIEMRENEKQKLSKLAEINETNKESSKSDIASLLAARIRTKGELKGFHPPAIEEIKNDNQPQDYSYLGVMNTKQSPMNIYDFCEYEQNSGLNLLDWRSSCNDFVEQLKCGIGKKHRHKPRSIQTYTEDKPPETLQSFPEMESVSDIKSYLGTENKIEYTPCDKQNAKELTSDSSDEDKPLLFLLEQNKIQVISKNNLENTKSFQTLQMCSDLNELPVNKSTHSSIVEKLSEKIGRNIREKQRIEQEKRLAARLGKTSSSESEDNQRHHRQKKSKITRTRISAGISTRELSDTENSGAETISMSNNFIRSREMSKKRKSLENFDFMLNVSKIRPLKTKESNIVLPKLYTEKQVMTKAEMKFMMPSKEMNSNIPEQNRNKEFILMKNIEVNLKKANHYEINSTKGQEVNKSKTKKLLSSTCNTNNAEVKLEETMTRSKRKKALEHQIANSKILRNDKIINYINADRNKKTNKKKQEKNIRKSKISRSKSGLLKNNIIHKNGIPLYSSASSNEFETVTGRLRPRRLSLDNNRNCRSKVKSAQKQTIEKMHNNKNKLSTNHSKRSIFKTKVQTEKCNTPKFPPGWEDQVYEYKKSLKVPLRLITIKGPHNHRISTSLPDLDSHSSDDAPQTCPIGSKNKVSCYKNDTKLIQNHISNNSTLDQKLEQLYLDKDNSIEHVISQNNSPPKSIIDVLHSRVIRSKKIPKKNVKPFNIFEQKVLPRSTNELELLPTPTILKTSRPLDEHHNVFTTEVLKARTRTETRNLKNKELIREVFGGEDRPASAPPEIRKNNNKLETKTFEEKYEQYLQKMNVDFGEKIRKHKSVVIQSNEIENKTDIKYFNNSENINNDDRRFSAKEYNGIQHEYMKRCIEKCGVLKDKGVKIISDGVVAPTLFKHKKNSKYRSGRRRGSSGFDYIRKKKKPPSAITSLNNQDNVKRKKNSLIEFHHNRNENDVCKEIQKWVLNKSVGQSALHKAARLGYLDVIAYCLERMGMNPDPKDNAGYTPLHEACSKGRIDIARVLLQYGANHSETAHSGIRPLHEASENGYIEIVRLLLSYGADPLLTTYSGQTPLMLSESNEMEHFIKNHLYDVQNTGPHKQPWKFHGPWKIFDPYKYGYDALNDAPDNELCDVDICDKNENCFGKENKALSLDILDKDRFILNSSSNEKVKVRPSTLLDEGELFQLEEADIPLPPLYLLKDEGSAKWVLLSDLCNLLKVKSKDTLLKQICPSTPPSTMNKELLRELKMSDFLEKATCLQLLCAGEKLNIRASKVILVKYNERVQTLLGVRTIVMKL